LAGLPNSRHRLHLTGSRLLHVFRMAGRRRCQVQHCLAAIPTVDNELGLKGAATASSLAAPALMSSLRVRTSNEDAHEGRGATDRRQHRTAAGAAASRERRLNGRRPMPQTRGVDDRSAGAFRRPSLVGAMFGLTPEPTRRVHELRAALHAVTPAAIRTLYRLATRHGAAWQRRLGAPYPADTGSARPSRVTALGRRRSVCRRISNEG
jgi:hypothetical protein